MYQQFYFPIPTISMLWVCNSCQSNIASEIFPYRDEWNDYWQGFPDFGYTLANEQTDKKKKKKKKILNKSDGLERVPE